MSYHTHTHKGKQQKYIIAVHKFRHIIFYTLYILQFLWAVSSGCTASFFQASMKKKRARALHTAVPALLPALIPQALMLKRRLIISLDYLSRNNTKI